MGGYSERETTYRRRNVTMPATTSTIPTAKADRKPRQPASENSDGASQEEHCSSEEVEGGRAGLAITFCQSGTLSDGPFLGRSRRSPVVHAGIGRPRQGLSQKPPVGRPERPFRGTPQRTVERPPAIPDRRMARWCSKAVPACACADAGRAECAGGAFLAVECAANVHCSASLRSRPRGELPVSPIAAPKGQFRPGEAHVVQRGRDCPSRSYRDARASRATVRRGLISQDDVVVNAGCCRLQIRQGADRLLHEGIREAGEGTDAADA